MINLNLMMAKQLKKKKITLKKSYKGRYFNYNKYINLFFKNLINEI